MRANPRNRRWQELDKSDIPLDRLAQHFEAFNRSEGKSLRTVEWYSQVLKYFGSFLRERNLPDTLGDLDIMVVREFILYLQTRPKWPKHPFIPEGKDKLAAISVQNYARGLRAFFSWLHREGYTQENMLASCTVGTMGETVCLRAFWPRRFCCRLTTGER